MRFQHPSVNERRVTFFRWTSTVAVSCHCSMGTGRAKEDLRPAGNQMKLYAPNMPGCPQKDVSLQPETPDS